MDDNNCFDCAFKHVATAMVIWHEMQQGYNDYLHLGKFVGHMSEASDHLLPSSPELANLIRDERIVCYDNQLHDYRPKFEMLLEKIIEAGNVVIEEIDTKV